VRQNKNNTDPPGAAAVPARRQFFHSKDAETGDGGPARPDARGKDPKKISALVFVIIVIGAAPLVITRAAGAASIRRSAAGRGAL